MYLLVPVMCLTDPLIVLYFVAIRLWMPGDRLWMPCDGLMMIMHLARVLTHWSSNSRLVVICHMLLPRHPCVGRMPNLVLLSSWQQCLSTILWITRSPSLAVVRECQIQVNSMSAFCMLDLKA